jgi:hypothetical protein
MKVIPEHVVRTKFDIYVVIVVKEPKQDSQIRLRSSMPEGGEP